ncbi:MAG: bifunctional riboflavin kinase/FAD synthetase [Nitrospinota bacterium]
MEIIKGLEDIRAKVRGPVLTIGNFDGVHLGHRKIFRQVVRRARELGCQSCVFTFEPHPLSIIAPEKCPLLLASFEKKMALIEESGMQVVICAHFDRDLGNTSPEAFIRDILHAMLGVQEVFVGFNFGFGRGRAGGVALLKALANECGFGAHVIEPVRVEGRPVSSTTIRHLLGEGRVEEAAKLLGRFYSLGGRVVKGSSRGKALGFPTANLDTEGVMIPLAGIYAGRALLRGHTYGAVINIGWSPTFGDVGFRVEVHILDFSEDIQGEELELVFIRRLREERRFGSAQELALQIERDVEEARALLEELSRGEEEG